MKQLTCIRPAANPNSDLPWPTDGVIHPPHPAGVVNAGQQVVVLAVVDAFDETLLPPGWTVKGVLVPGGNKADRATAADVAPFGLTVANVPIPMGW
ncbi:MAG: hypothetical protein OEW11_11245 [Nitrospirota bacterium]|nr:hypothetical protein [Nitrospirota bacterium]